MIHLDANYILDNIEVFLLGGFAIITPIIIIIKKKLDGLDVYYDNITEYKKRVKRFQIVNQETVKPNTHIMRK